MREYFYNTNITSAIVSKIIYDIENYEWILGDRHTQWHPKIIDQSLIELDPFLFKFHDVLKGKLNLFKFPPKTFYKWHLDRYYSFNLNMIFNDTGREYVIFKKLKQDPTIIHDGLGEIVECRYETLTWHVFNAQIPHCVCNLNNESRYLLTYNVSMDVNISYDEFLSMI